MHTISTDIPCIYIIRATNVLSSWKAEMICLMRPRIIQTSIKNPLMINGIHIPHKRCYAGWYLQHSSL